MEQKGYIGKVSHKGAQVVKAPYTESAGKSSKVVKGEDLRAKKSK